MLKSFRQDFIIINSLSEYIKSKKIMYIFKLITLFLQYFQSVSCPREPLSLVTVPLLVRSHESRVCPHMDFMDSKYRSTPGARDSKQSTYGIFEGLTFFF